MALSKRRVVRRTIGLFLWVAGGAVLALYVVLFVQAMLGPHPVWLHLRDLLFRWQTFITGCLALIAAGLTIRETRNAADRQVRAAGQQVRAAGEQTEAMRTIERRRIARGAYAFYAMMDAAMESVLADVEGARKMIAVHTADPGRDRPRIAYEARTRVKQAGFSELRTACLRYGSQQVTPAFLRLDKAINDLSSASKVPTVGGNAGIIAVPEGLPEELDHIEALAKELRDKVGPDIERCTTLLAETPEPDFS